MGEVIKIPVDLMKEDLNRIAQWISLIKDIEPVALSKIAIDRPQSSRAMNIARSKGEAEPLLDYAVVTGVLAVADVVIESILDAYDKRRPPLSSNQENESFTNFVSGANGYSAEELFRNRSIREAFSGKTQDAYKQEGLRVYSALLFTRDTFTIMFNLLPTLSRIEKLLTLQAILLAESSYCTGKSHPVAFSLRKALSEGILPWKGNDEMLDDDPAVEIWKLLRPGMQEGYPVPPDFASFAKAYPSWDAFWQIATWKSFRMEKAIEAVTRELLVEAWKCPEKSLSGTMPEPDEAIEPEWDWMTETTKPGISRVGVRPFAYGNGHPVAESLWDVVWDAEHERRSYTDEIPLTFPKDLHTFRCAIPVDTKAVRKILDHPWRYAAETDLPDFTGLWGGFTKQAEQLFSGKESLSRTAEGKEITWKDLRDGAESIYKRGIGILDHLASVQEYYRPLRAIDPVEWRDTAEMLKEEHMSEMAGRAENLEERMK